MLWIGIIEDVFQMEGKKCKDLPKLNVKKKINAKARKLF